jgi:hypothetical protein
MKIISLIIALLTAGTLAVFGQEGTVQEIKHEAKKAGQKIEEGAETVGEKTKQAVETVEKNEGDRETVGKDQRNCRNRRSENERGYRTAHYKSTKPVKKRRQGRRSAYRIPSP